MLDIVPFIPFFARPPNKVLEEFEERFDDGAGHTATLIKVRYLDSKKKKEVICVKCVIWDKE